MKISSVNSAQFKSKNYKRENSPQQNVKFGALKVPRDIPVGVLSRFWKEAFNNGITEQIAKVHEGHLFIGTSEELKLVTKRAKPEEIEDLEREKTRKEKILEDILTRLEITPEKVDYPASPVKPE